MVEIDHQRRIRGLSSLIGNTGIAFASIGRALGHPVTIFMPSWMSAERINLIRCLGTEIVLVSREEGGFLGSIRKAEELGIGVGISSGANFLGALQMLEETGPDAIVVTVFPDDNKKYLSTDLLREEPVKPDFFSPRITLTGVRALKRVCKTCCDPDDCREALSLQGTDRDTLPECPVQIGGLTSE